MSRPLALIWALLLVSGCDDAEPQEPTPEISAQVPDRDAQPAATLDVVQFGSQGLEAALKKGIVAPQLDDATYRVDPFVAALIFEELRATAGRPTFTHVQANEPAPAGFAVSGVNEGDLWHALGLRNEDVVEALGGVLLTDVDALGRALDGAENRVRVTIFREDLSFTASYRLDGGLAWRAVLRGFTGEDEEAEGAAEALEDAQLEDAQLEDAQLEDAQSDAASTQASKGRGKTRGPSKRSNGGSSPRPRAGSSSSGTGNSSAVKCTSSACTVAKRTFDGWVASPKRLQSGVDIVPAIRNDVHSGYKLKRVSSRSAIYQLGFRTGDKITHVNGRYLGDEAQALALYLSLSSARVFKIRFERGGRKRVKTVSVR